MVFTCCIPGCGNKTSPDIPLHCLPKDPQIRAKWCISLNRPDLLDVSDRTRHAFRVCDIHFTEDSKFPRNKKRTNLKCNTVPTLHLQGISRSGELVLPGTSRQVEATPESEIVSIRQADLPGTSKQAEGVPQPDVERTMTPHNVHQITYTTPVQKVRRRSSILRTIGVSKEQEVAKRQTNSALKK